MSKKEHIAKLIEEGKSFQEIVELSGAKHSYVKAQFTKAGKNWRNHLADAVVEEEPKLEIKNALEEAIAGEVEEVVIEEEVKEDLPYPKEIMDEAKDIEKAIIQISTGLPVVTAGRVNLYKNEVVDCMRELDFSPMRMIRLNVRYRLIKPFPAPNNNLRDFRELHLQVRNLFDRVKNL